MNFLNNVGTKTVKPKGGSKAAPKEAGWSGNGIGSGKFQDDKKRVEAETGRKNINMAT